MSQHTPGPWTAVYSPGMKGPGVHIRPHKNTLDIAYANSSDNERPEADARLIAAAPTMLETLEQVKELLEGIDADRLSTSEFKDMERADELLAKAIKRARGEK